MNPNPMTAAQLFALLAKVALVETPTIHNGKFDKYLDGMSQMAQIYLEIGFRGELVSPDVDPLILAAVGYEESRHRPHGHDGDCTGTGSTRTCHAVGPMQLATSTPGVIGRIDPKWQGYDVERLRDPHTNVEVAYRMLKFWKAQCSGGPAVWLGAYSAGRCTKRPIPLGKRRCALAGVLSNAAGYTFDACAKVEKDKHIAAIEKQLAADTAVKEK